MNKVIIVGGDHHNGLNLARIFGLNNVLVDAVVVTPYKNSWMATSKYIINSVCVKNETEAFDYIIEHYKSEPERPFIIPYSDGAAFELDKRLDDFKTWSYIPSINEMQGEIGKLMDKQKQFEFAKKYNIPIAESFEVNTDEVSLIQNYDEYIIKPVVSAFGNKHDICICKNNELQNSLRDFSKKGYRSVLVQQYLHIDYEMVVVGAIYKNRNPIALAHKVIRRWPRKTGTNSFSVQCTEPSIIKQCEKILSIIQGIGYCGLIDVEVFVVNKKVYLNEINWRNSGGDFRALNDRFFYAFWWYLDMLGQEKNIPKYWQSSIKSYSIVGYTDIRNVFVGEISIFKWIKIFFSTKNHSLFFYNDNKPFYYKLVYAIINKLHGKR